MSTYKKFGLLILLSLLTMGVFAQELVRVSNNINCYDAGQNDSDKDRRFSRTRGQ